MKYILSICFLLSVSSLTYVAAVTDAELEALEKQIEQIEQIEQQEAEDKQRIDAKAKADKTARIRKEAEARAQAEEVKQTELERQKQEEETKAREKAEEEKRKKFNRLVSEAEQAINDKDKELAMSKYKEALALVPGDVVATRGIKNAESLKHKLCYDVLGTWVWDKALGNEIINLNEDGSIDYQTAMKGSGSWECTNPESRTIKIRVSMLGFSNEWLSKYSVDGSCLQGPESWGERGCYHRPESGNKSENAGLQEQSKDTLINGCSKIIGVWRWNDLAWTITRFYEDGKVVSKNILKSEGTWECVDPGNRRFTFNTWNKKRDIQIEDDYKKLHSVGVLGEKLSANKISDNPFEKIVPAKNSSSDIQGL